LLRFSGPHEERDEAEKTIERWLKQLKEQGEIVFSGSRKSGGCFVSE